VLMVGDADATASVIGQVFRLKPRVRDMKAGRYAFCKVGSTVLEIVGPSEADKHSGAAHVWGITFGVDDIDRAVGTIRSRGVDLPDPHDAIQGGRIVSVPAPVGGIQIAFMGR
jgi:predicted enzyme related to lactoylglutathione lyase